MIHTLLQKKVLSIFILTFTCGEWVCTRALCSMNYYYWIQQCFSIPQRFYFHCKKVLHAIECSYEEKCLFATGSFQLWNSELSDYIKNCDYYISRCLLLNVMRISHANKSTNIQTTPHNNHMHLKFNRKKCESDEQVKNLFILYIVNDLNRFWQFLVNCWFENIARLQIIVLRLLIRVL